MTTTKLKLGFIGLGIMGAPMALHLVNAGHQLFVNTVGKPPDSIASSSAKARGNAEPGCRVRLHQKDPGLALQGARELGLSPTWSAP